MSPVPSRGESGPNRSPITAARLIFPRLPPRQWPVCGASTTRRSVRWCSSAGEISSSLVHFAFCEMPRDSVTKGRMNVLFIGGTGIISSACTRLALERGINLTLLTRGQHVAEAVDGAETVKADINDAPAVSRALQGRQFDV